MLNAIFFYRIAHRLYLWHTPIIPKIIDLLIFLIYNSRVPYQATIGKGTFFGYGGMGVVIHKKSVIGRNCVIAQQVTIGGGNSTHPGIPQIGDNVYISKGSIVIGGITVGNNATIGALSLVNKSVPDNAVVAGIPAKILKYNEPKNN